MRVSWRGSALGGKRVREAVRAEGAKLAVVQPESSFSLTARGAAVVQCTPQRVPSCSKAATFYVPVYQSVSGWKRGALPPLRGMITPVVPWATLQRRQSELLAGDTQGRLLTGSLTVEVGI